jgi:hypothetical protein
LFADKALAHVLTDDNEHLSDLVGVRGAYLSSSLFVSSHVDQQFESRRYKFVTNAPPLNSTSQSQQHQQFGLAAAAWSLCHQPSPG